MTTTPDVRPGQVWADNDPRSTGRTVEILEVGLTKERYSGRNRSPRGWETVSKQPAVRVRTLTVSRNASTVGRETLVLLDRFRPIKTGYVLIKDVTS